MITVICSNCKCIVGEKEGVIEDPDLPNISHGFCDDCLILLYPEQAKVILAKKEE
jgi:hypothetical protein